MVIEEKPVASVKVNVDVTSEVSKGEYPVGAV
jgi:hypothetical protein